MSRSLVDGCYRNIMGKSKKKSFLLILVFLIVEVIRFTSKTNTPLKQTHLVLLPAQVGIVIA